MHFISRQIGIINRCASMFRNDHIENKELRACLQNYILVLNRKPGLTQEQISREICVDKSGVTRHLAQLEKLGYVERRVNENDRRSVSVFLTQKGKDSVSDVKNSVFKWNEYITSALDENEMESFLKSLQKVVKKAEDYAEMRDNCEEGVK